MNPDVTRRALFAAGGAALASSATRWVGAETPGAPAGEPRQAFLISLNTATLRGHKLPLPQTIDIAARAGYGGVEPWPDEIDRFIESGGSLKDLRKRLQDHGLAVTGAVAFFAWMVDDDAQRARGFEEAKRRMAQVAELGGRHVAAPPAGDVRNVDLLKAAERYHELLEVGASLGVIPALEIWGGVANLHRLGQAVLVAMESQHRKACVLPDVFHLYRGGSGFSGIGRLNANLLAGFHLNDYPADPPRETIADKHRIYPGDGIAPLKQMIRDLRAIGYCGPLSVELFNPDYYRQDPALVARTALEKSRAVIEAAR